MERWIHLRRRLVVNYHTTHDDAEAIPGIVVRLGRELDARTRPTLSV
jgi:hypothetical protein